MKYIIAFTLFFCIYTLNAQFTVSVDTSVKFQTFKGFGAAHSLSYATGYNASVFQLREEWDNFGRANLRVGLMGDSAFITSKGQLDTGKYDFSKSELYKIAQYIKECKKWGMNRFALEVFSMPGWMKSSGTTACNPCNFSKNHLLPAHYDDFAKWLGIEVKEIIKITGDLNFYLSIQNEPRFSEPWPKCIYIPSVYADVLKTVGDYFQTNDTLKKIKFFGPTDMGDWPTERPWMDTLLVVRPDAGAYLSGWGNQGFMDGINPNIGDSSGWTAFAKRIIDQEGKELWMSSSSCSDWLTWLMKEKSN